MRQISVARFQPVLAIHLAPKIKKEIHSVVGRWISFPGGRGRLFQKFQKRCTARENSPVEPKVAIFCLKNQLSLSYICFFWLLLWTEKRERCLLLILHHRRRKLLTDLFLYFSPPFAISPSWKKNYCRNFETNFALQNSVCSSQTVLLMFCYCSIYSLAQLHFYFFKVMFFLFWMRILLPNYLLETCYNISLCNLQTSWFIRLSTLLLTNIILSSLKKTSLNASTSPTLQLWSVCLKYLYTSISIRSVIAKTD